MVYYVSIERKAVEPVIETPAANAATSNPVSEVNPTPQAQPSQESEASQVPPQTEEPKPAPTKQPATAPVKKASVKTASTATSNEPKKEDSKVGSILKKTGRILKKPFKL